MNKILAAAFIAVFCSGILFAEPAPLVVVNGVSQKLSAVTDVSTGHVMAALRDIEGLGWGKIGTAKNGEITFSNGNVTLGFFKNSSTARLNTLTVNLPVKTCLVNSKLMVPISFVAKSMGYAYAVEERTVVTISGKPAEAAAKAPAPAVSSEAQPADNSSSSAGNWFQGSVMCNGKKLQGIKLTLKNGNTTVKKASSDKDGVFAFYGIPDGEYQILVDNADNPDYKTVNLTGFKISGGSAKKLNKSINLMAALYNCTVTKDGDFYEVKWSNVAGIRYYKLTTACSNPKAKTPVYTSTKNSVRIPASELSKGQVYELRLIAVTNASIAVAQSHGGNWKLSTAN